MLLDTGPLGLYSAIAAIKWKPSIAAISAIAEPFLSAIEGITAIVVITWKQGLTFKLTD